MVKETGRKPIAQNRKARHDYHIEDVVEAGLVLTGTEVKSLRQGRASLVDAFAAVRGNELWLQGMHIPEYTHGTWTNHEPRRTRKLLLHRDEMEKLIRAAASGVVTDRYYNGGYGNRVFISHGVIDGSSITTVYNHLSRYRAHVGERVSRGEIIGYVGTTGYSTGCHLHFMVYQDGRVVNPMKWL